MCKQKERRNKDLKQRYNELVSKIGSTKAAEAVADEFYVSERTVYNILSNNSSY